MSTPKEVEDNYNSTWKEILENPDGSINKEQLKLELMDFSEMISRMTSLTSYVTRGTLSYPTYPLETIIEVAEREREEELDDQKSDDREDGVCSLCDQEIKTE